ncbi:MAG: HAMP domain-containing sensor histidine kinase [Bacteroidota bacterium]
MSSFSIRASTIRLGIFISTLVIATIIIIQLTWLKKVYRFEEKGFDHSIVKVIRGLYEDLDVTAYDSSPLTELIEKPAAHLYLARISSAVNKDTLASYLQYELEDFDIFTDCRIALYSAASARFIYSNTLEAAGGKGKSSAALPLLSRNYDYLALFFPNRTQYILSQMNFWIVSSGVLLIVLLLFGASLYYFYRQKFLNETQKDFIHNFAHEFKTPVAVISLAADVLKEETIIQKPTRLATYAGIVEYQAHYLNKQVDKLLKFAYTESRQLHLEKEPVDIHQLIPVAINNLVPRITEKNAQIECALTATDPVVPADRDYMLIVITNLLDNAIKYAKEPRVLIATKNENKKFILTVQDNGVGVERSEFKKIFRKFYRARNGDTYMAKGFGLGLTFTKSIVDAHEGKIRVDSSPGKGSSFQITLPIH